MVFVVGWRRRTGVLGDLAGRDSRVFSSFAVAVDCPAWCQNPRASVQFDLGRVGGCPQGRVAGQTTQKRVIEKNKKIRVLT